MNLVGLIEINVMVEDISAIIEWYVTLHTCCWGKFALLSLPIRKNRGAAHFAARGLHVGNGVGCPWASHGNFAMQIRLPTTSIYGNSGQLSGQLSRLPTTSIYGSNWQLSGQRSGLPMGILPCKLGCPLLPYMETVGSSVGCPWEFCHAN